MNRCYSLIHLLLSGFVFAVCSTYAAPNLSQEANKTIAKLYHTLDNNSKASMSKRLDIISASFLNKKYVLFALGEGENAPYDQAPLYRTDGFDCETYVDTVLAIALASNFQEFKLCLNKIRYQNGKVDFIKRNHFTSPDWNNNNQQQGFLKDVTRSIKSSQGQTLVETAKAIINRPSWYQHLSPTRIQLLQPNTSEQNKRLSQLKIKAGNLLAVMDTIDYIPLSVLFDANGKARAELFAQIPDAAIVEIIRPNWDLRKQIGTHLNVSHLGFVFWQGNKLVFRQASSTAMKVIDTPLIDYLRKALASPTIKGINVQIVVPEKPLEKACTIPNI